MLSSVYFKYSLVINYRTVTDALVLINTLVTAYIFLSARQFVSMAIKPLRD
jgi:hypothetical protein